MSGENTVTDSGLTAQETQRYSRHLSLPEVGIEGQQKLKAASVLLIGAGGLGSPLALYLAAAGIGRIGIVDYDVVDFTNLQRQILHGTSDVGRAKLDSARARLVELNPEIKIETHNLRLDSINALELIRAYDIVADGTDNFATRYLVNDACVLLGKPNVFGSIFRFEGQASVFWAARGPCYRCLYPTPPAAGTVPNCAEGGVLGVLPGIIGTIQATEVVKLIIGRGEPLIGRLLLFDALAMKFRELKLSKDPACPVCGTKPTITSLTNYEIACGFAPAATKETTMHASTDALTPRELKAELDRGEKVVILDVREPYEIALCSLPGALLIPQGQLEARVGEIERTANIVTLCRSGARSARAQSFLRKHGFTHVRNLSGGILAWSDQVDPTMPKY